MLYLTKWLGVTESDAERGLIPEEYLVSEIEKNVLLMQAKSAKDQHKPLRRGTHAKGICVQAELEILDFTGKDSALRGRLEKGIFAKAARYPAIVRFANADSNANRDAKPDVRSLSFSADLTQGGNMSSDNDKDRTSGFASRFALESALANL